MLRTVQKSNAPTTNMQIFVGNLKGKTMTLRINSSDIIEMVKDTICMEEGIPQRAATDLSW
jgi:hypothetical protein